MMDPDRTLGAVPARASDLLAGHPPLPSAAGPGGRSFDGPLPTRRRRPARLIWRGLRRHWWQAAVLWSAASAGLIAWAHHRIRPTFDASSTIRFDPVDPGSSRRAGTVGDFEAFKETQARRVAGFEVIAAALAAHPELLRIPRLARAEAPESEVRDALAVMVLPGTNLIQVSLSGESPGDAARVVDAVVDAYLDAARDDGEEERLARCRKLRQAKEERAAAVQRKRAAIARLVDRIGSVDAGQARDRGSSTFEAYRALTRQHLQADLDLVEAQAALDRLRDEPEGPAPVGPPRPEGVAVAAFYATPKVAEVFSRLARARDELSQAERAARDDGDRSRQALKRKVDEHQTQLDALWAQLGPALTRPPRPAAGPGGEWKAAERKVDGLRARLGRLDERLGRLEVQARAAGADELSLEFARQDLVRAESVLDAVTRDLDRVEFEAGDPAARIRREYRARPSGRPDGGRRLGAMAAASAGIFLAVLGLFALVELRGGRVVDPDELPARLRLDVLGVVPPLPRPRRSGRDGPRSRRDLDRFLQSLDHLQVALCSGTDARGRPRRSLVITSACGGEGKTTLAAQLAERCANAGLATLLIDADLRNPTLSRMFDRPSGRGLVNILGGEVMAEEAIAPVGDAGGFHFLAAGSPRVDPARLLQGDRMARLLARSRASFDIVIVDAPPVLPVPDALAIGRWVDGAVLAVRFDSSRYPMVERAHRRLAAVGVPVFGAVINGVRGAGSDDYGPYDPPRGSPEAAEGASTIEI